VSSALKLLVVALALVCIAGGTWFFVSDRADAPSTAVARLSAADERDRAAGSESLQAPGVSNESVEAAARVVDPASRPASARPNSVSRPTPTPHNTILAGKVITDEDAPVHDVLVVLTTPDPSNPSRTKRSFATTDERGTFRFPRLVPGKQIVSLFSANAPAERTREFELAEDDVRDDVQFVLSASNLIAGRVLDPDGQGVAGAMVQFAPAARRTARDELLDAHAPDVATGAGGSFSVPVPENAMYVVRATVSGSAASNERSGALANSETLSILAGTKHVALYLRRKLTVSGVVRWPNGEVSDHAGVIAKDADGREVDITYADAQGRFAVSIIENTSVDLFAYPSYPLGGGRQGWSMADKGPNFATQSRVPAGRTDVELRLSKPQ
jgi:hypothetical protein